MSKQSMPCRHRIENARNCTGLTSIIMTSYGSPISPRALKDDIMVDVLTTIHRFDKEKLAAEVTVATGISSFDDGPYGNCISLPSAEDLGPPFRTHHNNVPFSGALGQCPYLDEIFDSFLTEKAAFRLLRRKAKTAYALHDDKDKGSNILRFQIPVNTNENSFLLLAHDDIDLGEFESLATRTRNENTSSVSFDLKKLDEILAGRFELFSLQPGQLYYFDTDNIHTLINAGDQQRVTLSLDLVINDWLNEWMQTSLTQKLLPSNVERTTSIRWEWPALKNGVIRND